ncbi:FabD/lysophospholipase-like protein [Favolaschia claudopus]|uniref:FabD/lysophospholipase-like protein n=1 Tax=Favolaschia claudopus TaxID=2862362 RepID=A0AAW0A9Q8_9AGAR
MDSGQHITIQAIHGGTGGAGGSSGSGVGGSGGTGEAPQFNISGASQWNVHTVPSFTGRQETLQEIHQYFEQAQGTRLIFILHGLGGSGKSQLAFKYVREAQDKKRFCDVFFIDATSNQTTETDLKLLAPTANDTLEAALSWLASNHNEWLIVFDNADDVGLDIAKFFPPSTFGSILITTRNSQLCIHGVDSQVSNMALDDASYLLLKLVGRKAVQDNKKELATAIVKELHCFALAVSQAGGYINAQGDLEGYLALYKVSRDRLLKRNDIQGQSQYHIPVYATWDLSYNKLSQPAKLLLQIFAQLHHEGITKEIFEKAALSELQMDDSDFQVQVNQVLGQLGGSNQTWDALVFSDILGELQAYSLIEQNLRDQSFSVHPLIQQWSNYTTKQNIGFIQTCALAIIAMSYYFNREDFKFITGLLHHMTRLSLFFQQPLDMKISVHLAYIAEHQGRCSDAEGLQVAVLDSRKRLLGEEHPDTLLSMDNLARTYSDQGRWSDAEGLQVAVLESRKQLLGEEHPDTLLSMNNLASTYSDQGRWTDAEELEACKRLLGEEHPDTLTSMDNLACTYSDQGRWSDAEGLQVAVLESQKKLLGEEHPNTLNSMSNLACTYSDQGRWTDAEGLQVAVLESRKRLLGEDHPYSLLSMNNLAHTYGDQDRWSVAEDLQVTALESRKRLLGKEHPATLLSMNNLAHIFEHQARYSEAEALRRAAQDIEQRRDAASKHTQIEKLVASPAELALPGAASENPVAQSLHETYTQNSKKPRKWKRNTLNQLDTMSEEWS